jgi:hypothetical protein
VVVADRPQHRHRLRRRRRHIEPAHRLLQYPAKQPLRVARSKPATGQERRPRSR